MPPPVITRQEGGGRGWKRAQCTLSSLTLWEAEIWRHPGLCPARIRLSETYDPRASLGMALVVDGTADPEQHQTLMFLDWESALVDWELPGQAPCTVSMARESCLHKVCVLDSFKDLGTGDQHHQQ